ncbi:transposase [Lysobacter sp. CA199]|uniref:transposase n=1 Tax=Lysobacter sp. CA199 TaxID=3455608 RepID=UPI003F8D6D22
MTPAEAGAISRMMQVLGRRYVRSFNERYRRRGTLWEGRYKSCLVDSDDYLLRCYRYIELNPVRARMVATPEQYRWSSYRSNALGSPDALVKQHDVYRALGFEDAARRQAYAALVSKGIDGKEIAELRDYLRQGRAWGSGRFQAHIEEMFRRVAVVRPRGRPSPAG